MFSFIYFRSFFTLIYKSGLNKTQRQGNFYTANQLQANRIKKYTFVELLFINQPT